jgi:ribonuclease HII
LKNKTPIMLQAHYTPDLIEAGCDEAGRGCLAGPVVAASVILPKNYRHDRITDSKRLSARERLRLRDEILHDAECWAIAEASSQEVDEINVLNASILAMHRALARLTLRPQLILVDGNRFKPFGNLPHRCLVKGDATYLSIAAASILAKTYRDELMCKLASSFPGYGWDKNFGYPTAMHRRAIQLMGLTPFHRKTFRLDQKELLEKHCNSGSACA